MKQNIFFIVAGLLIVGLFGFLIYDMKNPESEEANLGVGNQNNLASIAEETLNTPVAANNKTNMKHLITIKTNYGDIQFETYDNDAPKAVNNFVTLADKGFYNGVIFHRIIKGFMIQGGDPTGTGMGGPGYQFADELNPNTESYKAGYKKGVVAMANAGPNTNGSQFFIMLEDYPLPNNYTIFGKVVKGQEIVDKVGDVKTDANDKPLSPVTMTKVSAEEIK
ncbi:MAG: peptidylprolyl isomerase [Candidatus Pacebacteria bacterium]|nr:peptidylprolyl isomerase [Candidatus Paceibacterota bacterium]